MGKFEKSNRPHAQSAARRDAQARRSKKKKSKLPLVLGIMAVLVVAAACAAGYFFLRGGEDDMKIAKGVYACGIDLSGMTREEAKEALQEVTFEENMNIRLYTMGDEFPTYITTYDPATEVATDIYGKPLENPQVSAPVPQEPERETDADAPLMDNGEPYLLDKTICLPASNVEITLDVDALVEAAYAIGRSEDKKGDRVDIETAKHMTVNEEYILEVLESTLEDTAIVGDETRMEEGMTTVEDEDGNQQNVKTIEITIGDLTRDIDIDALFDEILEAYGCGNYDLQYIYSESFPAPVDLDALYAEYDCVAPVNAVCDEETYEVTEGLNGFGFRMSDAVAAFERAKAGDTVVLTLQELEPGITTESIRDRLFADVLGSYDSPHVYNPTRTHNLELACEAIDGFIVKPGAVFSFNEVVGERTAEKGYGEAGVYVGGRTEQQLGGGVCQVASTIFYCTLKADLEVVERYEHQYLPSYVPYGMDATIYWGSLDYRFRNNTAYPIRIDADVYDGYVHIRLVGTNTKDYTVELDYEITAWFPSGEKIIDIWPEMDNYEKYSGYRDGETIQTAYDGANVTTYMYKYDLDGNLISTEIACYSRYDSRDREIAHLIEEEPEPSEDPTESSSEETTEAPTESSSVEATEPPTESSSEEATEPTTESSETP